MLQNVKVDIIYYLTNTDFEMEFNLCGCCRMRLLTDKASDRKSFIGMLARAVSRSRIIIACGGLFSETGLIETVATAIGKSLETVDNKAYGISGNSDIKIISGATPLVTPEGYFGGCIIESGPQTIILLSESRNVRKTIMQTLIHPYIEEFSLMSAQETSARGTHEAPAEPIAAAEPEVPAVPEEIPLPQEDEVTEDTEAAETSEITEEPQTESEEISEEQPVDESAEIKQPEKEQGSGEIEFVFDEEPETEPEPVTPVSNDEIPMHLVPERVKYSKKNYYDIEYKTSESDDMFISDIEGDSPRRSRSLNVPIVIISVILVLLLLILAYFLIFVPISGGYTWSQYINSLFSAAVKFSPKI